MQQLQQKMMVSVILGQSIGYEMQRIVHLPTINEVIFAFLYSKTVSNISHTFRAGRMHGMGGEQSIIIIGYHLTSLLKIFSRQMTHKQRERISLMKYKLLLSLFASVRCLYTPKMTLQRPLSHRLQGHVTIYLYLLSSQLVLSCAVAT